jgi:hypothetical protein
MKKAEAKIFRGETESRWPVLAQEAYEINLDGFGLRAGDVRRIFGLSNGCSK